MFRGCIRYSGSVTIAREDISPTGDGDRVTFLRVCSKHTTYLGEFSITAHRAEGDQHDKRSNPEDVWRDGDRGLKRQSRLHCAVAEHQANDQVQFELKKLRKPHLVFEVR